MPGRPVLKPTQRIIKCSLKCEEKFIKDMERTYPGIIFKRLIGLAFACALGVTFLVLACALPQYNNWWPMFVLFFYFLSPLPTVVGQRLSNGSGYDSSSSACIELCIFITTGIVVSSLGLPVVLAHVGVIQWGACALVMSGNVVVFLTILAYFKVFGNEDVDYGMW